MMDQLPTAAMMGQSGQGCDCRSPLDRWPVLPYQGDPQEMQQHIDRQQGGIMLPPQMNVQSCQMGFSQVLSQQMYPARGQQQQPYAGQVQQQCSAMGQLQVNMTAGGMDCNFIYFVPMPVDFSKSGGMPDLLQNSAGFMPSMNFTASGMGPVDLSKSGGMPNLLQNSAGFMPSMDFTASGTGNNDAAWMGANGASAAKQAMMNDGSKLQQEYPAWSSGFAMHGHQGDGLHLDTHHHGHQHYSPRPLSSESGSLVGSAHNDAQLDSDVAARLELASSSASRRRRRQRAAAQARDNDDQRAPEVQAGVLVQRQSQNPRVAKVPSLESQCARWTSQLEGGGAGQDAAISEINASICEIKGHVRRLTFEGTGCRIVQLALQSADHKDAADLVAELYGYVRRAIASPHGNYVIQKVVTELPTNLAEFVASELLGVSGEACRHRYGCRIICRLVEHSTTELKTVAVVDEILIEASELCRHNFGHHVIQSILEHGLPAQKHKIAVELRADLTRNARNRNATYVIERALMYCSPEDQHTIATALLNQPSEFVALAQNQFGFHVVRAVVRMTGETSQTACVLLQCVMPQLQRCKYGARIVDELRHHNAALAA